MARPLNEEEFGIVQRLVDSRAEGMFDDGIYDDLETAHEFAWEMVRDDILTADDLAEWARFHKFDSAVLEVDRVAIAEATNFAASQYNDYLQWYAEHLAPEDAAPPAPVPRADIETIDRHRATLGLPPIDADAGWTRAELREMARSIRETGRMANVAALKRRLT